ncbi:hypothetical protein FGL72_04380 [Leuconostoc citreum]|uniref:hypothetical protein n=1 Tax=Leuconostoc citreum TaxID=33964 RepID=UPI001120481C|nr:hypothetical protein [Leuconostoc citreum]QEA46391.1 hypothetical protein FGL82_08445 [Leuconostoc citreum]QEA63081.1 hypothetical protein FGL72_04380 [Leuconostoc citreum]TOY70481.1 hypothetical protein DIS12_03180 [Leuconostoc citreum]
MICDKESEMPKLKDALLSAQHGDKKLSSRNWILDIDDVEIVTDIPFMSSFSANDETDLNIKIKRLIQLSNKIKYAKLDGDKDNMINDTVTN